MSKSFQGHETSLFCFKGRRTFFKKEAAWKFLPFHCIRINTLFHVFILNASLFLFLICPPPLRYVRNEGGSVYLEQWLRCCLGHLNPYPSVSVQVQFHLMHSLETPQVAGFLVGDLAGGLGSQLWPGLHCCVFVA